MRSMSRISVRRGGRIGTSRVTPAVGISCWSPTTRATFRRLYAAELLHAGLVILIPTVSCLVQQKLFRAALDELAVIGEPVNRVIEVDLKDEISFNLAQGAALGDAVQAIEKAREELGAPMSLQGSFQGSAQAFQASLASEPYLIAAALVAVYIILGILYESYILPLTILSTLPSAGVGALLMLMLAHTDLSVIAMIGVFLLIGIVKKNGIMLVDFGIHAERNDGKSPLEAIRQACLLRFRPILMTTMAALAERVAVDAGERRGLRTAPPAGGRRAAGEPGADALHHAGHLFVFGYVATCVGLGGADADAEAGGGYGGRLAARA